RERHPGSGGRVSMRQPAPPASVGSGVTPHGYHVGKWQPRAAFLAQAAGSASASEGPKIVLPTEVELSDIGTLASAIARRQLESNVRVERPPNTPKGDPRRNAK